MKLKELLEEFKDYVKSSLLPNKIPVFVNPTREEMLEVAEGSSKHIRFIIDKNNKNFYVFTSGVMHFEVASKLQIGSKKVLLGIGAVSMKPIEHNKALSKNYSWARKYLKHIKNINLSPDIQ